MSQIRIGTRGSLLARWQAEHVKERLTALGHEVSLVVITTTGDQVLDRRLEAVGGKGAFLKEIEEALEAREVDLAVHSLKDVPTVLPDGLELCAILERADPRDALLSSGDGLDDLPRGATVGTTSLRRQAQLRAVPARPLTRRPCEATSTRASAGCEKADSTRSCSRWPASCVSAEPMRRPSPSTRAGSFLLPGRVRLHSSVVPTTPPCARPWRLSITPPPPGECRRSALSSRRWAGDATCPSGPMLSRMALASS